MTVRNVRAGHSNQPLKAGRRVGPGLNRNHFRRGISLIEVVVLMTGVAAMLGLTVIMLQLLMKLDADSRARLDTAGVLARLAQQFRGDVHTASAARLLEQRPKAGVLRIEPGPDRAIEYQVKGTNKLLRVETLKAKTVRTERYEIARGGSIDLVLKQDGGHQFASLTVDRRASKYQTDPPRLFEILAQVGRNKDRIDGAAATAKAAAGGKP